MTIKTAPDATLQDVVFRFLHIGFHADAAVIVFFVLSGLVLSRSLRNKDAGIVSYILRRAFRLVPVAVASALIIGYLTPASTWSQIIGASIFYDISLNGVLWTLQIEVWGSLWVYAAATARRTHPALFVALLVATFAVSYLDHRPIPLFMSAFALGALVDDLPTVAVNRVTASVGLLALMTADFILGPGFAMRCWQMLGAFCIVAYVSRHSVWLTANSFAHFLGRISYPFYLLHLAGALIIVKLGVRSLGLDPYSLFVVYGVASITIAMFVAWLIHTAVEVPGMTAGETARGLLATPSISPTSAEGEADA
ncbi:Peptidoglycan/LPS O-acetylase OafA/YrhL, contains acyltransferase and SGNH-hydrolase domains [Mesorhizobium qingshengii]|uniref:Peptidoglycan/LPS O-acetylase OafA/YrhL, contains acyltransferase and SGNH-hydrolase domains n=2 Tax=Mesorhizobium qingshengii TaxID=1165689 RepID=A0A1G5V0V1_9HYPH|nr:Peptidoglycan/LPS O-acetylase OafA/YrhL, contains acyltransferase and SGNH-hydrolase domains [Mesorhizobium qingshengii]